MSTNRQALGMVLNVIGVAYYGRLWFQRKAWRSFYQILQASRVVVLWNLLHRLGSTSSGETRGMVQLERKCCYKEKDHKLVAHDTRRTWC